jgi:serine/threonine-protein kinase
LSIKRFAVLLVQNALLVAGLLAAAALSALVTMRVVLTSQEVVVPSLLGKRVPEAGAIAARHALLLRVEGKRHDAQAPPDTILAQDPPPKTNLKAERSVRVWLSLGPRRLFVPVVEGQGVRAGRLALEQAQLPVGRVVEVDDAAPEGTILVQRPAPGQADPAGDGVALLVSRGARGADYLMPDLIGRRADAALDALRRAGLKVADVRYRAYPGVAPGIVLRQAPPAGHRASQRATVSLEISH